MEAELNCDIESLRNIKFRYCKYYCSIIRLVTLLNYIYDGLITKQRDFPYFPM